MSQVSDQLYTIPQGKLVKKNGSLTFVYTTFVRIETVEQLEANVMQLMEAHCESWGTTKFSGQVHLECWNSRFDEMFNEAISIGIEDVVNIAQKIIDDAQMKSVDGNAIVLSSSFTSEQLA